jgi:hypothetical protein
MQFLFTWSHLSGTSFSEFFSSFPILNIHSVSLTGKAHTLHLYVRSFISLIKVIPELFFLDYKVIHIALRYTFHVFYNI